jgi:catechol 2,3-dioxygenase-like lactoylglutathione lyase family enzyme
VRPAFREPFPTVTVTDVARSIAFYRDALGFTVNFRWPADESAEPEFVTMSLDGREIGIGRVSDGEAPAFSNVELCLEVDDIEAAWTWLVDHRATKVQPPTRQPWGESNAYVADPDGLKIHIYCKTG